MAMQPGQCQFMGQCQPAPGSGAAGVGGGPRTSCGGAEPHAPERGAEVRGHSPRGWGGGKEHQDKTREARDEDIREPGVAGLL